MFITQLYTLYHALFEFTSGEIKVKDSCARKRVEYRVQHRSTVIGVKHCFKSG